MKHFNLKSFGLGVGATILVAGLSVTALAATGQVTFNASNLSLNGTQISAKGENYTLANGQSVPASITYTDEKGGGTTYLPVRRIAELMGVETGWDGTTGSVTVKGEVKAPAQPTTPPDTTTSTDYSHWSKEDEAAYQEFKVMWSAELTDRGDVTYHMNGSYDNEPWEMYKLTYVGTLSSEEVSGILHLEKTQLFLKRLAHELRSSEVRVDINLFYSDGGTFGFHSFK